MPNWLLKTDGEIFGEVGNFIQDRRLAIDMTQQMLAKKVGVSRWTINRLEQGHGATTSIEVLVRVARVLNFLDKFELVFEQVNVTPIDRLRIGKEKRKRATRRNNKQNP